MAKQAVLAFDVGGTKTLCALVSDKFKVLAERKFKTAPEDGRRKFVKRLVAAAESLAQQAKLQKWQLLGAGVAWAGQVNEATGKSEAAPNLVCLEELHIGRLFREAFGLKTVLGNDVQFALYAEQQLGAARNCRHVLGVFFGTGVGGAGVINGKLYQGVSGMGGQVGSILVHNVGGPDTLESHGILDRIASKAAIAGAALGIAAKQWAPHLFKEVGTDLAKVSWGALHRAIRNGDTAIEELVRARLRVAGIALASVVNFMNPEMLVLGGGLTEEMPRLVKSEIERGLREYLVPEVAKPLQVRTAHFKNHAGAMGAAKRAFDLL
jgi:glucokinase